MPTIDFNPRTRRLEMQCTFAENHIGKSFPARQFNPKKKVWDLLICRRNVEHMKKYGYDRYLTPAAVAAVQKTNAIIAAPAKTLPFPLEYRFKTEPMGQQRTALDRCWSNKVFGLFMEMGTGKSKVAIDKASMHFARGEISGLLIFCPVSIRDNWVNEIHKHCPIDLGWKQDKDGDWSSPHVQVLDLSTKSDEARVAKFLSSPAPFKVLIAGIQSLSSGLHKGRAWDVAHSFALSCNHMQVVDEAHMIKGPDSTRTANITALGLMAKYKLVMTGTPVTQGLLDLFSYFEYLDPSIIGLGDFSAFKARYALLSDDGFKRVVGYDNVEELVELVEPYIYQVTKKEAMPWLPDKSYRERRVTLSDEQKQVYSAIKNDKTWSKGPANVVIENALQRYSALQSVVAGFINYDVMTGVIGRDGVEKKKRATEAIVPWNKNPKIAALLEELETYNGQALIWAFHKYEIQQVVEALSNSYGPGSVVRYTGDETPAERSRNEALFHSGKARFFVANQATGGVGLTLVEAELTVYMSNTFKLIDRAQSEDRNHRHGQTKKVTYVDIVAAGTVDRDILAALRDKRDLADWLKDRLATGRGGELAIS